MRDAEISSTSIDILAAFQLFPMHKLYVCALILLLPSCSCRTIDGFYVTRSLNHLKAPGPDRVSLELNKNGTFTLNWYDDIRRERYPIHGTYELCDETLHLSYQSRKDPDTIVIEQRDIVIVDGIGLLFPKDTYTGYWRKQRYDILESYQAVRKHPDMDDDAHRPIP